MNRRTRLVVLGAVAGACSVAFAAVALDAGGGTLAAPGAGRADRPALVLGAVAVAAWIGLVVAWRRARR